MSEAQLQQVLLEFRRLSELREMWRIAGKYGYRLEVINHA